MSEFGIREAIMRHVDLYFRTICPTAEGKIKSDNLYRLFISEVEEALIAEVLQRCAGNQSHAAKILGISRNTLKKKLKQYDL